MYYPELIVNGAKLIFSSYGFGTYDACVKYAAQFMADYPSIQCVAY